MPPMENVNEPKTSKWSLEEMPLNCIKIHLTVKEKKTPKPIITNNVGNIFSEIRVTVCPSKTKFRYFA